MPSLNRFPYASPRSRGLPATATAVRILRAIPFRGPLQLSRRVRCTKHTGQQTERAYGSRVRESLVDHE